MGKGANMVSMKKNKIMVSIHSGIGNIL